MVKVKQMHFHVSNMHFWGKRFFPEDIYLGELMSTVCVARVRGWTGVGACSAEGVGDGLDPAGGRLGHRSRCSAFRSEVSFYCHVRVSQ